MLRSVGLGPDQVVQLHVDLTAVPGRTWAQRADTVWRGLYFAVPGGTFLVPTFTYAYGDKETPYDPETSPSEVGLFSEWCRQKGWPRSLHPIFSFVANGPRGAEFVDDVGPEAFGDDSVFDRLVVHDGMVCFIGAAFQSCTFVHHAEWVAGFPMRWEKRLRDEPWTIFARERNLPGAQLEATGARLVADRVLYRETVNGLTVMAAGARPLLDKLTDYLYDNIWTWYEKSA
jgi:aminoglycoside N3'-acetyltransferase